MSVYFIRLGGAISYGQGRDWAFIQRVLTDGVQSMYIPREV